MISRFEHLLHSEIQAMRMIGVPAVQECVNPQRKHRRARDGSPLASGVSAAARNARSAPWPVLLSALDMLRADLSSQHVPPCLQRKLFVQLFSFVNVHLFNQLLLNHNCCSLSNGKSMRHGLARVRIHQRLHHGADTAVLVGLVHALRSLAYSRPNTLMFNAAMQAVHCSWTSPHA